MARLMDLLLLKAFKGALRTRCQYEWKLDGDTAIEATLDNVIPRLSGILERDGRGIKPCLIHGDLWKSNIGTDARTDNIYILMLQHTTHTMRWRLGYERLATTR